MTSHGEWDGQGAFQRLSEQINAVAPVRVITHTERVRWFILAWWLAHNVGCKENRITSIKVKKPPLTEENTLYLLSLLTRYHNYISPSHVPVTSSRNIPKNLWGKGGEFSVVVQMNDQDINKRIPHTATRLKMVSLFDFMPDSFKGKGHYVINGFSYMSDAMCLVGWYVWLLNFVGTCMANWCGVGSLGKDACKANEIVIGGHDSLLYQHNTHPLMYAAWGDNNFVRTLSNFHSPIVVPFEIMRKVWDPFTKVRAGEPTEVHVPEHQLDYCETYYWIDKGNGAEAKYDLSTESHLHGWPPKLSHWCFNMNTNNSYKLFCAMELHPVLLRTLQPLLVVMEETNKAMLTTNRGRHQQLLMGQGKCIPVLSSNTSFYSFW